MISLHQKRRISPFRALLLLALSGVASGCSQAAPEEQIRQSRVLYLYGSAPPAIHQMKLADDGPRGLSEFKKALEEVGFALEERLDADVKLDAVTLNSFQGLILGSNNRRFSGEEAAALKKWVENGGGVVAWSDSAFGGHWRDALGNTRGADSDTDLLGQFGMKFLRDNGAGTFTIRQWEIPHALNKMERSKGVVFRGEGVSLVRTGAPAQILARLQLGGTKGTLRLHQDDGPLQDNDAALAVAEIGKGRVVGVFDRNGFWNAGEGSRLSEVDNREFAQRLLLWITRRAMPEQANAQTLR